MKVLGICPGGGFPVGLQPYGGAACFSKAGCFAKAASITTPESLCPRNDISAVMVPAKRHVCPFLSQVPADSNTPCFTEAEEVAFSYPALQYLLPA